MLTLDYFTKTDHYTVESHKISYQFTKQRWSKSYHLVHFSNTNLRLFFYILYVSNLLFKTFTDNHLRTPHRYTQHPFLANRAQYSPRRCNFSRITEMVSRFISLELPINSRSREITFLRIHTIGFGSWLGVFSTRSKEREDRTGD